MIDRVLGAFDRWLGEREPDQRRRREATGIVRTACELKSSYLGESNPADWNPKIAVELVGQVFPRKVAGMDEANARAVVPAIVTYIEFLVLTGRWKPQNDAAATRTALSALEPDLPGRFNDPNRLSMAGRLMQLAIDEGIDITEPGALDGFMQRFNDMPYEWRKRLTDAPGIPGFHGDLTFEGEVSDADRDLWNEGIWDDDEDDEDDEDDDPDLDDPDVIEALEAATATAIAVIGFVPEESVPITVPGAESELAALLATPLLTRMTALTEWVRPGRKLTSTMAMRRADTLEWLRRFGLLTTAESTTNSMWDRPELAAPWSIAAVCGLIDSSTTKARPGPKAGIFDSADIVAQILCARDAVGMLIHSLMDVSDEMSELDQAVVGLLLALLTCLCRADGVELAEFRSLGHPGTEPTDFSEGISRILFVIVLNIVDMLVDWDIVTVDNGRSSVPPALRPAVVQAINVPDAPFSITLEPGAVPLEEQ